MPAAVPPHVRPRFPQASFPISSSYSAPFQLFHHNLTRSQMEQVQLQRHQQHQRQQSSKQQKAAVKHQNPAAKHQNQATKHQKPAVKRRHQNRKRLLAFQHRPSLPSMCDQLPRYMRQPQLMQVWQVMKDRVL